MPVNSPDLLAGGGPNSPLGLQQLTTLSHLSLTGFLSVGSNVSFLDTLSVNTLSMATYTAASGLTRGEMVLVLNASGMSLAYSSGRTTYYFGGSTVSEAQA